MNCSASRASLLAIGLAFGAACEESPPDLTPVSTENGAGPPVLELANIDVLPTNDVASLAISPDGRQLVFSAELEGRNRLWVQDLETGEARPLPGTEEGFYPFWSPDNRHIGFYGNDQLKRLDLETGAIQVLVPVATWGAGGSWGADGTILYATHGGFQIKRIPASGDMPRVLVSPMLRPGQAHVHPQFLPGGVHYLFYAAGSPGERGIYVGELGSPRIRLLVDSEAAGVFTLGRLFLLSNGTLMAQGFDTQTLSLTGTPEPIAEDVRFLVVAAEPASSPVHLIGNGATP